MTELEALAVLAAGAVAVGLVPGGVAGSFGYRRELRGQWRRCAMLAVGTTVGALLGGILLLELPDAVFDAIVPALILLSVALMALRPAPKINEGASNDK